MDWMRMYHEARTDGKLAVLTDSEFRVWFNLLLYSSEQETRGTIDAGNRFRLAAEVARGDEALLDVTINKLIKLEILAPCADGDSLLRFIQFRKRQYSKSSDEPEAVRERVRKYRERQRNAGNDDENACNDECNASVTPSNALDTDTDKPKDMCVPFEPEPHECDPADADEAAEPPPANQRNAYPADFERFWQAYPPNRRVRKKHAHKAWAAQQKRKQDERAPPEALIAAAERYAAECAAKGTEARYVMHPATFLGPNDPYADYLQPIEQAEAATAFDEDPDAYMARLRAEKGDMDEPQGGGRTA